VLIRTAFEPNPRARAIIAALAFACSCGARPAPPHLFLITVDTLRADHTGIGGYERATTPHLDALAREALVFEQAITLVPKTGPSLATHWTGLPPEAHGVTTNKLALPADVPVLAERLADAGFDTAAFVSNPILSRKKGFARGFARYSEYPKDEGLADLTRDFLAWASERSWETPSFVWIHLIDPHGPYTPPENLRERFTSDALFRNELRRVPLDYQPAPGAPPNSSLGALPPYQRLGTEDRVAYFVSQYDAEIVAMDEAVGSVLAFLRENDLFEDAGIVFTSDHGESLGEHDYYFEHGWFVHDATLRVPLVVKAPDHDDAGRIAVQVSNLDTLPTLLAMAGVEASAALPGRDLLAELEPRAFLVRNPASYPENLRALRTPEYKLVRNLDTGREQLFALTTDPNEERDVAAEQPERLDEMRRIFDVLASRDGKPASKPVVVEVDERERALLERLGYTDR